MLTMNSTPKELTITSSVIYQERQLGRCTQQSMGNFTKSRGQRSFVNSLHAEIHFILVQLYSECFANCRNIYRSTARFTVGGCSSCHHSCNWDGHGVSPYEVCCSFSNKNLITRPGQAD